MNPLDTSGTRHIPPWVWHVLRLLGLPFVIYVVMKVEWDDVLLMYRRLGLGTTLGMLASLVGIFLLRVRRWFDCLRFQGVPRPWWEVFGSLGEAYFYGFITPARLGEAYRLRHLTEWGLDMKRAMGNLLLERGMDVCMLGSLSLLCLGLYTTYPHLTGAVYGLIAVAVVMGALCLLLLRFPRMRSWITQRDGTLGRRSILVYCFVQTVTAWALLYVVVFWVRGVLGIPMGPVVTLFSYVLSTMITAIPISVAGFGTKELALMHFLAQWGYTTEQAVAFSLIFAVIYVLNLLFSGVIWFAILAYHRSRRSR